MAAKIINNPVTGQQLTFLQTSATTNVQLLEMELRFCTFGRGTFSSPPNPLLKSPANGSAFFSKILTSLESKQNSGSAYLLKLYSEAFL